MSRHAKNSLQRLLDAFRHARYPDGFPLSRDEDTLAKMLMSEFQDWCNQQGLASHLEKAEKEATPLEAAEELEDAFAELADQGKARSISVPRADGTIERRWSLVTKEKVFLAIAAQNSGKQLSSGRLPIARRGLEKKGLPPR